MSVQPNGNVSVTCTTTNIDRGQPGNFTLGGPASLTVGMSGTFSVTRNGGNAGSATITPTVTGGCTSSSAALSFPDGGATSQTFTVAAPATAGTCTIGLNPPTGAGQLGSTSSMNVSITAQAPDPVGPCGAVPNDVFDFELKLSGADVQRMASGRIGSAVLPVVGSRASGQVILGEATTSPRGAAVVEISINKCRGVIDTSAGACYLKTDNPTFTTMTWLEGPVPGWGANTDAIAAAYNLCQAYTTNGTYYVNMRYTYSQCSFGNCGFVSQWNYGAF